MDENKNLEIPYDRNYPTKKLNLRRSCKKKIIIFKHYKTKFNVVCVRARLHTRAGANVKWKSLSCERKISTLKILIASLIVIAGDLEVAMLPCVP